MAKGPEFTKILRRPGEGLLTVTTGSGAARKLLSSVMGRDLNSKNWGVLARSRVLGQGPQIIAFPSDIGGGVCRGAAHGPLHLRAALYRKSPKWAARDLGDIPCIPQLLEDGILTLKQKRASGQALWGKAWTPAYPVAGLNILKDFLSDSFSKNKKGFRPLVVGGDHSTSWAVSEALYNAGLFPKLAILHFDAHTDLLETRYGVDHCFATWAAHAARRMKKSERSNFVQLGVRVSGRTKTFWEKKFGLRQIWTHELTSKDPGVFAKALVESWKKRGCERLYISFDVDALDPKFVPSTGTAEAKGLDLKWCSEVIKVCTRELPLVCADIVELAPVLGSVAQAHRSSRSSAHIAELLLKGLARGL